MSETVTIYDNPQGEQQPKNENKKKASTFESVLIIAMLFVIAIVVGTFTDRANREFYLKEQNDLWGFVAESGKEAIPFIYEEIEGTSLIGTKDIVVAKKDGKWGAVNYKNETVIDFIYDDAVAVCFTENSIARVFLKKDGKWGVVDKKNKQIADFIYEEPFKESETPKILFDDYGVACVKKNGKYGIINLYAKEIVPFVYDEYFCFSYENDSGKKVAIACKDGKCGAIDSEGNTIVDFKYDFCCCYMEYYPVIKREYCDCECSFGDEKKSCIEKVQDELKNMGYKKAD